MKAILTLLFFLLTALPSHSADSTVLRPLVSFSATTTSTLALAKDNARKYLLIQNTGANDILVKFDSAHSASEGIKIIAGGNYEPLIAPTSAIYIKTSSSTSTVSIVHGR